MRRTQKLLIAVGSLCVVALGAVPLVGTASADPVPAGPVVPITRLDGATTGGRFTLAVDVPRAETAKLVVDGRYVGRDVTPPLTFDLDLAPGAHKVKVRTTQGDAEGRSDARFTVASTPSAAAAPSGGSTPTTSAPSSTPTPASVAGEIVVDTVSEIRAALASAAPGTVIRIADGEYTFKPRLVASASGTAAAPITLVGSTNTVIRTKNASGDYGLHVTGDHWRIKGITVAHASKGIVLDGSVGTVLDGVEVYDTGAEGIHFRSCSSDGVLRNSYVHDTGRKSAQYGEGVYVGSANSNWSSYTCTDPVEGVAKGDNTERVLVEDNLFEDITAEGADLKEGTDSGILRRNVFRRAGTSGMNSADSAVDAKGNGWVIEDNVVTETDAPWDDDGVARPSEFEDGFQTHAVYDGYGVGNVFRRNRVEGDVVGFGFGLYPGQGNVVACDNVATGAAKGLVGDKSKPSGCRS